MRRERTDGFGEGVPSREGELQRRTLENVLLGEGKANMELVFYGLPGPGLIRLNL